MRPLAAAAAALATIGLFSCHRLTNAGARFGSGMQSVDYARVAEGDDPRRARPSFDDSAWPQRLLYEPPRAPSLYWIRSEVVLPPTSAPLGLYVSMAASFEAFWDGERIGSCGTIARGQPATAGPMDNLFVLDGPRRTPGPHTLALRVAAGRDAARIGRYFQGIVAGDYAQLSRGRVVAQVLPLSGLGVFLVIGAYCLAMWLAERRLSLIVFSLLCFAAGALVVAESYRWIVGYAYDWHYLRLCIVNTLTFLVALLLPLFFVLDLELPRPRLWAIATAAALTVPLLVRASFDTQCLAMFSIGIAAAAAAIILALVRRRREAIPYAAGTAVVAVALVAGGYNFGDHIFFLAFAALIASLLVSLTLRVWRQRRERDDARIRAARLEIELLKRSIHPHFLMNTLTAVMEWIEEDPPRGMEFLEALADELRILHEVSSELLIPIAREVELCRSHLAIMSCRKGTHFDLVTEQLDREAAVPPTIFHTLLENAMSHNRYDSGSVSFRLREERSGARRTYVLDAPLSGSAAAREVRDGLGLRYVKTRLEETFPGRWRVDSSAVDEMWRTTIELTA